MFTNWIQAENKLFYKNIYIYIYGHIVPRLTNIFLIIPQSYLKKKKKKGYKYYLPNLNN